MVSGSLKFDPAAQLRAGFWKNSMFSEMILEIEKAAIPFCVLLLSGKGGSQGEKFANLIRFEGLVPVLLLAKPKNQFFNVGQRGRLSQMTGG